jgi:lysophospholipase L1-like esterase
MRSPRGWIGRCAIASCALLVLVACGKAPQLRRLGPDDVVLAFGDSLTHGTGARDEESYPDVLAALIGRKVVRAGVPGEVTSQGVRRLGQALDTHRPKIVLLCLGGNDMLRRLNDATIVANLRAMIAAAHSRGTAVVLLGVPRPALFGGAATFYADLADEYDLVYEGDVINTVLRDPALKSDPIHPNADGYRRIAEAIAALLRQRGALTGNPG